MDKREPEPRERLLRQLISDIIVELADYEAGYRREHPEVADDFNFVRRMLADGVTAATGGVRDEKS